MIMNATNGTFRQCLDERFGLQNLLMAICMDIDQAIRHVVSTRHSQMGLI